MSRLKLIVGLVEYDEKFLSVGRYEYKYTPINYVLGSLNSVIYNVKRIKHKKCESSVYRIIIKSELEKKDLREKVLVAFATDEKLSKGCVIIKIN